MITLKKSTLFLLAGALSLTVMAQTTTTKPTSSTTKTVTTTPKTVANSAKTSSTVKTSSKTKPVNKGQVVSAAAKAKSTIAKKAPTTTQPQQTTTTTVKSVTTTTTTNSQTGGTIKTQTTIPSTQQTPGEQKTVTTKTATTTPAGAGTTTTQSSSTTTNTNGKIGTGSSTTTTTTTSTTTDAGDVLGTITQGDASNAIKEALKLGVQVGVDKVSATDGFFGNAMIKIPFPSQVKQVETTLRNYGMGSLVDNAILSMNRAAESAAKQAGPIFLNSITQMTVTDAVNIVSNQQPDAATQFLKRTTTESLVVSFKPSIKAALDATLATKYWSDITGYYNKIPFVSPINTDLPDYVTRKAIDGLFYMVAQEEAKIRKNPSGTASTVISDVFNKVKSKF